MTDQGNIEWDIALPENKAVMRQAFSARAPAAAKAVEPPADPAPERVPTSRIETGPTIRRATIRQAIESDPLPPT
jgi:hypothetical protein